MEILISALVIFFSLLIMVTLFDHKIDDKTKRILLLTVILTITSSIGRAVGGPALLIAGIINFFILKNVLGYSYLTTILFTFGVELFQMLIINSLDKYFF